MKVLCHLSGGYDSAAALIVSQRPEVSITAIFYSYGQPYAREEQSAAIRAAIHLGVPLLSFDLPRWFTPDSDYVPMRNLVLTAHSVAWAAANDHREVIVGSKSNASRPGDPWSFRDSSSPFYGALHLAVEIGTEPATPPVAIRQPLVGWTKPRVMKTLRDAGFWFESFWSCFGATSNRCGTCHACVTAKEAWEASI